MKKIIGMIAFILTAVMLFLLIKNSMTPKQSNAILEKNDVPVQPPSSKLAFGVIGDVHTNAAELTNALRDFWSVNPTMDLLVLNGDIVDEGFEKEYTTINDCLTENKKLLPKTVIKNIGNHEFFDYKKGQNSLSEAETFRSRYLTFSGEKKVYHDHWVKDYHFISLGSERTYTSDVNSVQAFISDEQLNWLKDKLAEGYKPGKPIFVLLHQPYAGTKQRNELKDILSKYPEVILFSSHTHTYLENNNIAYQTQPFLAVHTGAVHRPLRWENNTVGRKSTEVKGSQGLYIEIDESKVVIKGRNFLKGEWINDGVYRVDLNQNNP
ncbi:MAG: metallophosphoesterase [Clostridia bacterium]|nr:metallophosphoesterase [Clostridia bacterium]